MRDVERLRAEERAKWKDFTGSLHTLCAPFETKAEIVEAAVKWSQALAELLGEQFIQETFSVLEGHDAAH